MNIEKINKELNELDNNVENLGRLTNILNNELTRITEEKSTFKDISKYLGIVTSGIAVYDFVKNIKTHFKDKDIHLNEKINDTTKDIITHRDELNTFIDNMDSNELLAENEKNYINDEEYIINKKNILKENLNKTIEILLENQKELNNDICKLKSVPHKIYKKQEKIMKEKEKNNTNKNLLLQYHYHTIYSGEILNEMEKIYIKINNINKKLIKKMK